MSDENIQFWKVDCAKEQFLCRLHVTEGYPTAKLFQRDTSVQFKGNRTIDGVQKWLKLNLLPMYTELKSEEEVDGFKQQYDYTMIGRFPSSDTPEFQAFATAANTTQTKAARVVVFDPALKSSSLSLFHKADNQTEVYLPSADVSWSPESVSLFEQSRATPIVEELSPFNGRYLADQKMPVLYFFLDSQSPLFSTQRAELTKLSLAFREKIMVALCDTRRFGRMRKQLGLSEGDLPSFAIECPVSFLRPSSDPRAKAHFCPTPLTEARVVPSSELESFVSAFLSRSLRPYIRSLPPPAHQFRAVTRLVGSTFEDVVMDPQRDVFVRLVVPWCLTCNRTEPLFELVAQDLKNATAHRDLAERIVLAEMDVSENDPPPDVVVRGHPTLLLFPAEDKAHPIPCPTWFSYEKMKDFLRTQLLQQPRWKGKDKEFPLTIDANAIADEDDLLEFDQNVQNHRFVQRPAEQTTPSSSNQTHSEL